MKRSRTEGQCDVFLCDSALMWSETTLGACSPRTLLTWDCPRELSLLVGFETLRPMYWESQKVSQMVTGPGQQEEHT